MKRIQLENGSARVEDDCPKEVINILNEISKLVKKNAIDNPQ